VLKTNNSLSIFKFSYDGYPKIDICLNVSDSFNVKIWHKDIKLSNRKIECILNDFKCIKLSIVQNLLNFLNNYDDKGCCVKDKLSYAIQLLDNYSINSPTNKQLIFLVQQLHLFQSEHPHYNPEMLLSYLFFYSSQMFAGLPVNLHTL